MIIWLSPKEWLKKLFCPLIDLCLESKNQNDQEKSVSCDSCIFRISAPSSESPNFKNMDKVYREIKRQNPKASRKIYVGGPDEQVEFCALSKDYFKKNDKNKYCKHWMPKLDLTVADAFAIRLNKKIYVLTLIILSLTIISVLQPYIFKLWQTETIEQNDNISKSLTSEKEIILLIKNLTMSDIQLKTEKESQNKR